jgi:aryl-alcohol dehydrogenase-like predicted oxidoreductase
VRHIGLSNETPYGVHEFVRLAEQHGLPRVASIQNPYCLINRTFENGLDESCHRWACRCWPTRRWASAC